MSNKPKNWFYTRPYVKATWIMATASCLMAIASCTMMWTLHQNQIVIKDNAEALHASLVSLDLQKIATSNAISQLQIEEETRLNPELECAFNPYTKNLLVRNAGDAPAFMIYMKTSVVCVSSNVALDLDYYRNGPGTTFPAIGKKLTLEPGEQGEVDSLLVPDMNRLMEFWNRFGDDVLVRIFVEYERPAPSYRRYSGYFNFVFDPLEERLVTEEENPTIQEIVNRYNAIPRPQQYPVRYIPNNPTNHWDVWSDWKGGVEKGGVMAMSGKLPSSTNSITIIRGAWTKHH